jgi:hypothetical protein
LKTHRSDRLEIAHTGTPIHHNRLATTVHLRIIEIYLAGLDKHRSIKYNAQKRGEHAKQSLSLYETILSYKILQNQVS